MSLKNIVIIACCMGNIIIASGMESPKESPEMQRRAKEAMKDALIWGFQCHCPQPSCTTETFRGIIQLAMHLHGTHKYNNYNAAFDTACIVYRNQVDLINKNAKINFLK